jgi:hypothetical protein
MRVVSVARVTIPYAATASTQGTAFEIALALFLPELVRKCYVVGAVL